jgi:hypothetical protein
VATPERERRGVVVTTPRAILAGLAASAVMLFGFIAAYGLAWLAATGARAPGGDASLLRDWLYALTRNPAVDVSLANLYTAVAVYFVGGLLWAVVYARFGVPYLPGPHWLRGAIFSLIPAAVTLVVALPLLGGGALGLALGAGPLPAIGIVLLHLLYGATLGVLCGPFGSLSAEDFHATEGESAEAMAAAERIAARATVGGLALGAAIGGIAMALAGGGGTVLGISPVGFLLATILMGAVVGALLGSFAGLPGGVEDSPGDQHHPVPRG